MEHLKIVSRIGKIKKKYIFSDYEVTIHISVSNTWQTAKLKGRRFYLGQSW